MRKFNRLPTVLVGDFDSILEQDFNFYKDKGVEIRRFPREKDITDGEIAVDVAIEKGCRSMIIIGAIGVRFDHTMGNIMMLKKMLDIGIDVKIVDEHNEVMLADKFISVKRSPRAKLSLAPFSDVVEGITTKGLYYPLSDATFRLHEDIGTSNEFVAETAEVTVKKGLLLVMKSWD